MKIRTATKVIDGHTMKTVSLNIEALSKISVSESGEVLFDGKKITSTEAFPLNEYIKLKLNDNGNLIIKKGELFFESNGDNGKDK